MKLIVSLLAFLHLSAVNAAETDHYTKRNLKLADTSEIINDKTNVFLKKAVSALQNENCTIKGSEEKLYEQLRIYFANHKSGKLTKWILHSSILDKHVIPLKNSVYGEWEKKDGFLLGREKAKSSPLAIAPMLNFAGQYVGTDKLEHIFGMGFHYFNRYYLRTYFKNSLVEVLKFGVFREKTTLGGNILATGVFSYADLSANFNGMRFWNHVLLKRDDILGKEHNLGPYVKCKNKKWIVNESKPIKFENYIDASMDESINCSKFASESGLRKFQDSLKRLNKACPMSPELRKKMYNKYDQVLLEDDQGRSLSDFIINMDTNDTVKYFSEFDKR